MPFFDDTIIERVRDANDIGEVIKDYVQLKPAGRNFKGLCPFHSEKTPSFMVHPDKQIFHCFGCGVGGNVIHFIMKIQNLEFPRAMELLAERAGIVLPRQERKTPVDPIQKDRDSIYKANEFARDYYHHTLMESPEAEPARQYLFQKRQLSKEIAQQFKLGYASEQWEDFLKAALKRGFKTDLLAKAGLILPRKTGVQGFYDRFREQVIFPIYSAQGKVVGFGGRFMDNREPKYLNSPETAIFSKSRCLYALVQASTDIREQGYAILMEGYMDVLQAHQCGIKNAVATLGTALTMEHAKLLRRYCADAVLMYDTDKAGMQAAVRGLEPLVVSGVHVKVVTLPEGKDPDEFLKQNSRDDLLKIVQQAKTPIEFSLDLAIQQFGTSSVRGKMQVIESLRPLMEKITQPAEKELYLRIIADRLQLDKQTLIQQYRTKQKAGVSTSGGVLEILRHGEHQMERELLKLLVFNPKYIPEMKRFYQEIPFSNKSICAIIESLYTIDNLAQSNDPATLLQHLDNEETIKVISELLMEEPLKNPEDYFQGFKRKLETQKIRQQQELLKTRLREAEQSGSPTKIKELQEQIVALKMKSMALGKAN